MVGALLSRPPVQFDPKRPHGVHVSSCSKSERVHDKSASRLAWRVYEPFRARRSEVTYEKRCSLKPRPDTRDNRSAARGRTADRLVGRSCIEIAGSTPSALV